MKATDLRCEYMRDPIGLGNRTPRLMWVDEDVVNQTAFDIELTVNGTTTVAHKETDDMYYDLEDELTSRDTVSWRVRIYNENSEVSEYSEAACFEIGLLEQSDFQGKWITGNYKPVKNQRYPVDCFRKGFVLTEKAEKARLYVSACGLYEITINGSRAGDFVLAPGFTDYGKRIQYQTYDVTELLYEGENVLEALLADGWYRGSIGAKGRTNTYGNQTRLYLQLEITDRKGNRQIICSDDSFSWSNDGPIRFADLKDGEKVDSNMCPSYSDHALECSFRANLTASDNFAVKRMEYHHPVKKATSATRKQIFELPYNIAGFIRFTVNGHKGQQIRIVMGEMLDENGDVSLKNVQCLHKGKLSPLQEIEYICHDGLNEYESRFFFGGFRYISVDSEVNFEINDLEGVAVYSSFEETSSFRCSNELINVFYENTMRSLKGNSIDIPTDCPTRERMGWTGDSQVFFNTASYLTNYAPFARKHVRDLFDRQWRNGKLAQIVPFSNEDWFMWVMNGSVGWADAGVLIPYRYYKKYGDRRLLEEYYDNIIRYGKFMVSRIGKWGGPYARAVKVPKEVNKYIVNCGQSYGEWAEPHDVKAFVWYDFAQPHPEESTAYTSWILGLISEICDMFDDHDKAVYFKDISRKVRDAYQKLVTSEGHSLDTDRQAKLVRPLYMHLLSEDQEEYAKKRLIKALDNYDWKLGTGFLSTPFILNVLAEINPEYAYRLLENRQMPGWLYMAENSTTTIWEGWEGLNSDSGIASLNHYSKGAMVEWLISCMCGIKVDGKNHFRIEPVIGRSETSAEASYDSVYGTVCSSWKRENGRILFVADIPANTTALIHFGDKEITVTAGHYEYEMEEQ